MKGSLFILLLLLILLLVSNSFAQLWYLTRGLSNQDERAWGVDVDNAGNIYWAVEEKDQWPYWYYNVFLFKIDPDGRQIWQSDSWGWTFNEIAFITKVSGANVYLGGRFDSTAAIDGSGGNALVLSYNVTDGNYNWHYIWDQGFGYEEIDGLVVQADGIYLSGWSKGQTSDMDFLVQKISLTGQQIWSNTWDYNNLGKFDGANGHMAMDDKFIYTAGHVNRTNIGSLDGDGALVCFSRTNDAYQWHVTWGGTLYDDALGLTMSADSMLYVVGYMGTFDNGSQIYLNKYSRAGQLLWSRLWGGNKAEDARALVADGDSIIYVVGATSSYGHGNGDYDIFVLKYDSAGVLIDSLLWGGAYRETAHDVAMYGDYLYITGETSSYGNAQTDGHHAEGLLLKVNARTMQAPDSTLSNVVSPCTSIHGYNLQQNFPNPFNSQTVIEYQLPQTSDVKISIFNLNGQKVTTLVRGHQTAGTHKIIWNGTDNSGHLLGSGVYLYRLEAHCCTVAKKMLLLR
jgi:hypothetical protein